MRMHRAGGNVSTLVSTIAFSSFANENATDKDDTSLPARTGHLEKGETP
jgi:hypothetical protein